jgi:hypothetical protein
MFNKLTRVDLGFFYSFLIVFFSILFFNIELSQPYDPGLTC